MFFIQSKFLIFFLKLVVNRKVKLNTKKPQSFFQATGNFRGFAKTKKLTLLLIGLDFFGG